jgi:hypothetical protein
MCSIGDLKALGVPVVLLLAGVRALADSRPSPVQSTALAPPGLLRTSGSRCRGGTGRAGGKSSGRSGGGRGGGNGRRRGSGRDSSSGSGSQDRRHGSPGGLLVVVDVVQEGISLTGEGLRNPTIFVREAPNRHAHTAVDVDARADDGSVVVSLRDQGGGRGGKAGVADVDFGVSHLDTEGGEAAEGRGELAAAGNGADDQVALEANTIDGSASILDDTDNFERSCCLGTVVLKVVVVVVPRKDQVSLVLMVVKSRETGLTAWCRDQQPWWQ